MVGHFCRTCDDLQVHSVCIALQARLYNAKFRQLFTNIMVELGDFLELPTTFALVSLRDLRITPMLMDILLFLAAQPAARICLGIHLNGQVKVWVL